MTVEMWVLLPHETLISMFGTVAAISTEKCRNCSGALCRFLLRKFNVGVKNTKGILNLEKCSFL
jgi:hypothetical protein